MSAENIYGFDPPEHELDHIQEPLRCLAYPIDKLKLDPNNARNHSTKNKREVRQSIKKHKFRVPIHVREETKVVQAGNLRTTILREEGKKWIPAILSDDDEEQSTAWSIVENRAGELGDWKYDELIPQLKELNDEWGIVGTGFSDDELEKMDEKLDQDMDWGNELDDLDFTDEDVAVAKILIHAPPEQAEDVKRVVEAALTSFPKAELQ